jgi:hypothetical protein
MTPRVDVTASLAGDLTIVRSTSSVHKGAKVTLGYYALIDGDTMYHNPSVSIEGDTTVLGQTAHLSLRSASLTSWLLSIRDDAGVRPVDIAQQACDVVLPQRPQRRKFNDRRRTKRRRPMP